MESRKAENILKKMHENMHAEYAEGQHEKCWGVCAGAQQGYNASAQFPKRYVNFTAFVAEHGSSSNPQRPGYRVAAVRVTNGAGTSLSHVNFASGWLINGVPWGARFAPLTGSCLLHTPQIWRDWQT